MDEKTVSLFSWGMIMSNNQWEGAGYRKYSRCDVMRLIVGYPVHKPPVYLYNIDLDGCKQ
jgi:hypothetical protein